MTRKMVALITSFERPENTEKSVIRFLEIVSRAGHQALVFLVDASQTERTRNRIAALGFENVFCFQVSPSVHWAQGMSIAESAALESGIADPTDILIWLNDDVSLFDNALDQVITLSSQLNESDILVGATVYENTTQISFSGKIRQGISPISFRTVKPTEKLQFVDTFNGNFVAVRVARAKELGGIDGEFLHHSADIEYGIRNVLRGGRNVLMPQPVGSCDPIRQTNQEFGEAWGWYRSIKGAGHKETRNRLLQSIGVGTFRRKVLALLLPAIWIVRFYGRRFSRAFFPASVTAEKMSMNDSQ